MIYFHRFFGAFLGNRLGSFDEERGLRRQKEEKQPKKVEKSFNCELFSFALPLPEHCFLQSTRASAGDGEGRAIVEGGIFIVKTFA